MTDPVAKVVSALESARCHPRKAGRHYSARCPGHEDVKASLSISRGDDGRAVLFCHAGCSVKQIREALNLSIDDLIPREPQPRQYVEQKPPTVYFSASAAIAEGYRSLGKPSRVWTYHDIVGAPVGVVCRWDTPRGKEIRPVSRAEKGWVCSGMPAPRPLYQLPSLLALGKGGRVFVCEGEKAADAIRAMGLCATTSAHGAKGASHTDWSPLGGKNVYLVPDNDEPGTAYMLEVADLIPPDARVHWVDLGLEQVGDDAHDLLWREWDGDCGSAFGVLMSLASKAEVIE